MKKSRPWGVVCPAPPRVNQLPVAPICGALAVNAGGEIGIGDTGARPPSSPSAGSRSAAGDNSGGREEMRESYSLGAVHIFFVRVSTDTCERYSIR